MGTVIIADGSGWSGRELAKAFLDEGYNVAVLSSRQTKSNGVARSLRAVEERPIVPYACRTTNLSEVQKRFLEVKGRFGSIDALVNNWELPIDDCKNQAQRMRAAEPYISSIYVCSYIATHDIPPGGAIVIVVPIQCADQHSELDGRLIGINSLLASSHTKHRFSCIIPGYDRPCQEHRHDYYPEMAKQAVRLVKNGHVMSGCITLAGNTPECVQKL